MNVMPAVVWLVAGCAVVVHRWHRRRKAKDLYKIPLAPGSFPVLGHVEVVKVRRPLCFIAGVRES